MSNDPLRVKQFGGDLRRFTGGMQQFQPGGSPVTYTDNPALVGMSNVDMISLNEGIPGLGESSLTGFMNTNAPVRDQSQDPKEVKTDPTQISSDQAKKAYQATPGDFSMDFKNKNIWEIDPEASLAVINAGARGVAGMIDRFKNRDRQAKLYDNLTADNLYASDPSLDRGDYSVTGSDYGLYRSPDQGGVHTSRSAQYGGMMYQDGGELDPYEIAYPNAPEDNLWYPGIDSEYMNFPILNQDILDRFYRNQSPMPMQEELPEEAYMYQAQLGGAMDFYDEGDEVYMSEDQLKDFLKRGGQVEYL
jgi:hypothetical protein